MQENREFTHLVRVEWEDTDAGGVVYHSNYINFMERARSALIRSLGFKQREMASGDGLVIVVAGLWIDYLRPARIEDELQVLTRIVKVGRASAVLEQEIHRGGDVLTRGGVKVACVKLRGGVPAGPAPMPLALRSALLDNICSPQLSEK